MRLCYNEIVDLFSILRSHEVLLLCQVAHHLIAAGSGGSNYKVEEYKQRENRQLRLLGYCTSAFGYIAKLGQGADTATAAAKLNILNVAGRAAARDGESKECLFQVSFVAQVSAWVSTGPPAAGPRPLYYCSLV